MCITARQYGAQDVDHKNITETFVFNGRPTIYQQVSFVNWSIWYNSKVVEIFIRFANHATYFVDSDAYQLCDTNRKAFDAYM